MNDIDFDICQSLIGTKFQHISRCCELVCMGFGDMHSHVNSKGVSKMRAKYALDISCPFRILKNATIIVGSDDLFIPSSAKADEPVNLDISNSVLFDEKVTDINNTIDNEYVTEIKLEPCGDLQIKLSTLVIQLFVATADYEAWRLFETDSKNRHLVAKGSRPELQ